MPRTVGQKAKANMRLAAKSGSKRYAMANKAEYAKATRGEMTAKDVRRTERTGIKAGIRERHPEMSAKKVRGRAAKQLGALHRKR